MKKMLKNHLVKSHKANSFDFWYVTSSSGLLQRVFKLCREGEKGAARGLISFTYLYRDNLVHFHKAYSLDIWYAI